MTTAQQCQQAIANFYTQNAANLHRSVARRVGCSAGFSGREVIATANAVATYLDRASAFGCRESRVAAFGLGG